MLEAELYVPMLGWSDKLLHFLGYCGLAFFAVFSFRERSRGAVAALSMIVLGAGVEFAQMLTPARTAEWTDAASNSAGVLCGMAAALSVAPALARRSEAAVLPAGIKESRAQEPVNKRA
jgi:VanZ family protein